MDLDATDRDLLAALLEDARISQRGLAKRVGVAQGTITNRLRRLEEWASSRATLCFLMPRALVGP